MGGTSRSRTSGARRSRPRPRAQSRARLTPGVSPRSPWVKSDVTVAETTRHLPGYSGHIPGLDAGLSKTFGASTSGSLQVESESIRPYAGEGRMLGKSMVPRELGLPHGQVKRAPARGPSHRGMHSSAGHGMGGGEEGEPLLAV